MFRNPAKGLLAGRAAGDDHEVLVIKFVGSDIVKCGNVSERDTVIKRFGKVHIVVNNAGVAVGGKSGNIAIKD